MGRMDRTTDPRGRQRICADLGIGAASERVDEPGLVPLAKLRYRETSGVSLDRRLPTQDAQGGPTRVLLAPDGRCHPDSLREIHWGEDTRNEFTTQALVS